MKNRQSMWATWFLGAGIIVLCWPMDADAQRDPIKSGLPRPRVQSDNVRYVRTQDRWDPGRDYGQNDESTVERSNTADDGYKRSRAAGQTSGQNLGLSSGFFRELAAMADRLQIRPVDLLAVMYLESRVRPDAVNSLSGATGLIQFLPSTLRQLGWHGTPADFGSINAEEQLEWVERYLQRPTRYGLYSAGRVYQAVFMPATLALQDGADTVLLDVRVDRERYRRNQVLDANRDGRITVGDLDTIVERKCAGGRWADLASQLDEFEQSRSR